jgi:hypothetical protein
VERRAGVLVRENSARRMPVKTVNPTRAVERMGVSCVGRGDGGRGHTIAVFVAPVEGPECEYAEDDGAVERGEVYGH